ncbi:aldehyde dehydrogenase-like protein [Leptotrombidium deliense]|uniref:Aldehyde dehydrogenase-like protein n=1 Tax=Leptotrombidium deliense TaxID=299467 RepID=A0A443RXI3_9ACAR|nr:aldehyde dehydrogenase-like protein [Leptotrombidium deliense]
MLISQFWKIKIKDSELNKAEIDADYLPQLETLDNGKPLSNSAGDIAVGVKCLRYCAVWATKYTAKLIQWMAICVH